MPAVDPPPDSDQAPADQPVTAPEVEAVWRGILLGTRDGEAGLRLADVPAETGEVWLPVDLIGEAKLVLTDELVRAALRKREPALEKSDA